MQGKIDENGSLLILRAGKWKYQYCPKRLGRCHDGCPKFGEPYKSHLLGDSGEEIYGATLRLCERDQLFFTEFTDNR